MVVVVEEVIGRGLIVAIDECSRRVQVVETAMVVMMMAPQ